MNPKKAMRVVLVDAAARAEPVRRRLDAAGFNFRVSVEDELPAGDDVIALGVGPRSSQVGETALLRLPRLALLSATSAGIDHIDVGAVQARGIPLTYAVDYCTNEVAEHTVALMLSLLRSVTQLNSDVHQGRWKIGLPAPRRVAGTVLGIWGFGRIGQAVARTAIALGMQVIVHARSSYRAAIQALGAEPATWTQLLTTSDVLSIHVPLSPSTRNAIGVEELTSMRADAYLINVSRGGIINESALTASLSEGHLAGVALDVTEIEPLPTDSVLLRTPRLILTPHAAWYSTAAAVRPYEQFADNIIAVLTGNSPRGLQSRSTARL